MIPQPYLEEWRIQANWRTNEQVEQDLIISRAIVEIFSDNQWLLWYLKDELFAYYT